MPLVLLEDIAQPAPIIRTGVRDLPILSMSSACGFVLDRRARDPGRTSESSKLVRYGQLVTGLHMDEGSIWVQNIVDEGSVSSAYSILDVDLERIDPAYLNYALHTRQSLDFYISSGVGSNSRRCKVPWESLRLLPIWLPSLREQESSVNLMREVEGMKLRIHQAFSLVDNAEGRLLDDHVQSSDGRPIEDLATLTFGRSPSSEGPLADPRIPLCSGASDFGDVFVDTMKKASSSDRVVDAGSVLLSVRDPVGRANIAPGRCAIGRGIVGITPRQGLCETNFLYLSLRRMEAELDSMSYGIIKGIGPREVKNIRIDCIDIDKQKDLSLTFDRLEKARTVLKNMLNAIILLEQRILEERFGIPVVS